MPKQLTIRGVPNEVGERLSAMSRAREQSVNNILLEILCTAVGVDQRRQRLERYATWRSEDFAEFQGILDEQREIDDELWR